MSVKYTKARSPSYPKSSLRKSVDYVVKIYESAFKTIVDRGAAVELMGFSGLTGPSTTALASLLRFGLLEKDAGGVKVTSLALDILEPNNPIERLQALREAAWKPEIFEEMLTMFGNLIPSDEVLRSYLVRQRHFPPKGADACIKSFRETLEMAELPKSDAKEETHNSLDINVAGGVVEAIVQPVSGPVTAGEKISPLQAGSLPSSQGFPNVERLLFRLSPNSSVALNFDGQITQSSLDKLIKLLELSKDSYPVERDQGQEDPVQQA